MSSDFWLVAGLGNPGKKYEWTRHNLGFMCLDELAARWSVSLRDHKGIAMLGKSVISLGSQRFSVFFCKPLTFMNASGTAIASICDYYDIEPKRVVVIHDDMDLDFGRIKVKVGGSSGGHNGIRSIDRSLGTNEYARVRLGTGHADRGVNGHTQSIDWVLGSFSAAQKKEMSDFLADGADAAEMIISQGLAPTQEKFNGR
jgi:PTH1 family peptidyl-tRNA hydrolase